MKKTINAGIGKRSFVIDEDAYARLDTFLNHFRSRVNVADKKEVMEDLEERIAELFSAVVPWQESLICSAFFLTFFRSLFQTGRFHSEYSELSGYSAYFESTPTMIP